jgi:hypothetical protein
MASPTLDRRSLNRAFLARQLLLERADLPLGEALEHLVGLQAQSPQAPYVGLWSPLAGFDPAELAQLLLERRAVRMRSCARRSTWAAPRTASSCGRSSRQSLRVASRATTAGNTKESTWTSWQRPDALLSGPNRGRSESSSSS